jgi:phage-related tail fiber protein
MLRQGPLLVATAFLLGACGDAGPEEATPPVPTVTTAPVEGTTAAPEATITVDPACSAAVEEAAAAGDEVWEPVFRACTTTDAFAGAVEENPGALPEGTDPATYVQEQCETQPELADTPLCSSL